MPCSIAFDVDRGLMILRASGKLTDDELLEARNLGMKHPSFDRALPTLVDFREVTSFDHRLAIIRHMAENPIVARKTRLALLLPRDRPWGLAHLFAAYAQLMGRPVEVFGALEEAERWLGVASPAQRNAAEP